MNMYQLRPDPNQCQSETITDTSGTDALVTLSAECSDTGNVACTENEDSNYADSYFTNSAPFDCPMGITIVEEATDTAADSQKIAIVNGKIVVYTHPTDTA